MSILSFVFADIERQCIRTHDPQYEACPQEARYDYIRELINVLNPYELLEYQVKYQQFMEKATPITPEAWAAILNLTSTIRLLEGPKDPRTKGLLKPFRDLLNSLILE